MGSPQPLHRQSVDEGDIGNFGKRTKRQCHCKVGGTQDVDPVDFLRVDHFDRPDNARVSNDLRIKDFTALFRQLFGIVEKRAGKRPR